MDRRTFLKTMTQAAAVAAAGGMGSRAEASMPRRMTVAAVGDCIPARRMSERKDRTFLDVVDLLRSADCTWGNCETVFADARSVYPSPKGLDPHCLSEPWGADEMAFMGIDCVGTANNHALDWGYQGLFSTLEHLERVGLAHAGAGADLAAASRPGYHDSAAGRVAQVNCTSTFPPYFAAAPAHPYLNGRPGLNVLAPQYLVQVDQELFDLLRPLQDELIQLRGWGVFADLLAELLTQKLPEGTAFIEEVLFKGGDGTDLLSQARQSDVERITQALAIGRNNARVVLATMHCHEARNELEIPDLFIEPFAHAAMDAGADLFFAAGPHVLRGIEIYDGKPIFYGLANFIFHYETLGKIPAESWMSVGLEADSLDPSAFAATIPYPDEARFWQSVIPLITLEGGAGPGGKIESPTVVSIDTPSSRASASRSTAGAPRRWPRGKRPPRSSSASPASQSPTAPPSPSATEWATWSWGRGASPAAESLGKGCRGPLVCPSGLYSSPRQPDATEPSGSLSAVSAARAAGSG